MARIIFGVMGDSFGHISRALSIAEEIPGHEFLFLGGGRVHELRERGYRVEDVPLLSTRYSKNRVDVMGTLWHGMGTLWRQRPIVDEIVERIKGYKAHAVLTDYEYFSQIVAQRLKIPCISVDHQHILTECICNHPREQLFGRYMLEFLVKMMYSKADFYLITSFFMLPLINPVQSAIFPPILRESVREMTPSEGDHILVYQTSPTFRDLLPVLEELDRPCVIYGFRKPPDRKGLFFKRPSEKEFLKDLASCCYAVTNGGHNVISEALFYGKPVLSFPIRGAYEQFYNAYALKSLGFGTYSLEKRPGKELFRSFERDCALYRSRLAGRNFCGNKGIAAKIEELLRSWL